VLDTGSGGPQHFSIHLGLSLGYIVILWDKSNQIYFSSKRNITKHNMYQVKYDYRRNSYRCDNLISDLCEFDAFKFLVERLIS